MVMAMATDYEKVYRQSNHALGPPTKEFVQFFDSYEKLHARVLDVGCGQGRDALFIGRLGHRVTGIDQSPAGIRDLLQDAAEEGLEVDAVVADVRLYVPDCNFDVLVIDRTLHMLNASDRTNVLGRLLGHVNESGVVLIADERANIADFRAVLDASADEWNPILEKRGFLFVQHVN